MARTNVFISYSHNDARWLKRLRLHLKPLLNDQEVNVWDDTKIRPGSEWRAEIEQAIAQTKIAVLLVSADFLGSEFITRHEIPPLLNAAEKDGAIILSLIIDASSFDQIDSLYRYQALNDPARPLMGLPRSKREAILAQSAKTIAGLLKGTPPEASVRPPPGEPVRPLPPVPNVRPAPPPDGAGSAAPDHNPAPAGGPTKQARKIDAAIWAAIISGVVALIVAGMQFIPQVWSGVVDYAGQVVDARSKKSIAGAKVTVDLPGGRSSYQTDADGYFYLQIKQPGAGLHIVINATDYLILDKTVAVQRTGVETFQLEPALKIKTYRVKVSDAETGGGIPEAGLIVAYANTAAPTAEANPASQPGSLTLKTDATGMAELKLSDMIRSADFEVQANAYTGLTTKGLSLPADKEIAFRLRRAPSPPVRQRAELTREQIQALSAAVANCKKAYEDLRFADAERDCAAALRIDPANGGARQWLRMSRDSKRRLEEAKRKKQENRNSSH